MIEPQVRCQSFEEAELIFASLIARQDQLSVRVRHLEKQIDTHGSPWWKRVWFRLNGWPPWYLVAEKPAPRFWHRWTGV